MKKLSVNKNTIIYYDIDFNKNISNLDLGLHSDNWPITYILYNRSNGKAYVGETTSFKRRMNSHLEDVTKLGYTKALFIDYDEATKSTILHLEAFLIRGLSISHELLSDLSNVKENSNKHTYYNEVKDEEMCIDVWNALFSKVGIVKDDYNHIRNKNEFKYSPYILLNENQNNVLNDIIDDLCNNDDNTILVEGASGTGKTAIAIQLFKDITNYTTNYSGIINDSMVGEKIDKVYKIKEKFGTGDYYSVAYVAPMQNFCSIIRKSISKMPGLRKSDLIKNNTFINDVDLDMLRIYSGLDLKKLSKYIIKNKKLFDLIIVDEAQRLNRRYNQSNKNGYVAFDVMNEALGLPHNGNKDDGNQLDWIFKLSKNQVFFYDKRQTIRSSDIPSEYFSEIFKNATSIKTLSVEERCLGGSDYINYIDSIFSKNPPREKKAFDNYEFQIYDNYDDMVRDLSKKDDSLTIKVSGYFFDASNNDYDVKIDGVEQKWNQTSSNWINSKSRNDNEIGCIHVIEGVDADFVGVIVGDEIKYENGAIVVDKANYRDKLGKQCLDSEDQLVQFVTDIYYVLLTRALKGTYLYIKDPTMKKYLEKYINKK